MKYLGAFVLIFLGFSSFLAVRPTKNDVPLEVSQDSLYRYLNTLAADSMQGRASGTIGQKKAGQFIKNKFQSFGLQALTKDASYYQTFKIDGRSTASFDFNIDPKGKRDLSHKDFYTVYAFETAESTLSTVWLGFGIDSAKFSDYKGKSILGKAVVLLLGEPIDTDSLSLVNRQKTPTNWSDVQQKVRTAKDKGAAAVFLVHPTEDDFEKEQTRIETAQQLDPNRIVDPNFQPSTFGLFFIRPKAAARLLGLRRKDFETVLTKTKGHQPYGSIEHEVTIEVKRKVFVNETENVIGLLEGTDKKEEVIVISAHYDHLGQQGDIFNGADDNGSGTAALLEIARYFSQHPSLRLQRSLLFIAFSGEEKGLLGSEYYVQHPLVPLAQTKAVYNIDMIGRARKKKGKIRLFVLGDKELKYQNEKIVTKGFSQVFLDYSYNALSQPDQLYYRSDHYHFYKKGIPIFYFTTGFHRDYHSVTDDADKINYEALTIITQLIVENLKTY